MSNLWKNSMSRHKEKNEEREIFFTWHFKNKDEIKNKIFPSFLLTDLAYRGLRQGAGGSVHTRTILRRRQLHHPLQLPSWRTPGTHYLHVVRIQEQFDLR